MVVGLLISVLEQSDMFNVSHFSPGMPQISNKSGLIALCEPGLGRGASHASYIGNKFRSGMMVLAWAWSCSLSLFSWPDPIQDHIRMNTPLSYAVGHDIILISGGCMPSMVRLLDLLQFYTASIFETTPKYHVVPLGCGCVSLVHAVTANSDPISCWRGRDEQ